MKNRFFAVPRGGNAGKRRSFKGIEEEEGGHCAVLVFDAPRKFGVGLTKVLFSSSTFYESSLATNYCRQRCAQVIRSDQIISSHLRRRERRTDIAHYIASHCIAIARSKSQCFLFLHSVLYSTPPAMRPFFLQITITERAEVRAERSDRKAVCQKWATSDSDTPTASQSQAGRDTEEQTAASICAITSRIV